MGEQPPCCGKVAGETAGAGRITMSSSWVQGAAFFLLMGLVVYVLVSGGG